jgi:hypothetical protein
VAVVQENALNCCPKWLDHNLGVLKLVAAAQNYLVSAFVIVHYKMEAAVIGVLLYTNNVVVKVKFVFLRKVEVLSEFSVWNEGL